MNEPTYFYSTRNSNKFMLYHLPPFRRRRHHDHDHCRNHCKDHLHDRHHWLQRVLGIGRRRHRRHCHDFHLVTTIVIIIVTTIDIIIDIVIIIMQL